MKVGADAMLLGAYAGENSHNNVLDIGCGTGIIGLMLAQKFSNASVTLIEINENTANEAILNISNSPYENRCQLLNTDFMAWETDAQFDLVVSNPPYHIEAITSTDRERTLARSTTIEQLDKWLRKISLILTKEGLLQLILPTSIVGVVDDLANKHDLWLKEELSIQAKPNTIANRAILSYTRTPSRTIRKQLSIRNNDGSYSESYKSLTLEFHGKAI